MVNKILQLPTSSQRVYGLDIVRSFAIIAVMLTHATIYIPARVQWLYKLLVFDGVTIFFVLSGFLIGGILIKTLERQPASAGVLTDFWVRRWVRTVPPYFLVLTLVCLLDWQFYSADLNGIIICQFYLFIQNLFTPQAFFFQEAWSLSIEEWFYLLVPISVFLLIALHLKPSRAMLVVASLVLIAVTTYRYYKYIHFPPADAIAWDEQFRRIVCTRLDSLMYGVLGAYWAYYYPGSWTKHRRWMLVLGISLMVIQQIRIGNSLGLYSCVFSFSLISLATLLILPAASHFKVGTGRLYQTLTHISLISYSMYLLNATILQSHFIEPSLAALHIIPTTITYKLLGLSSFWVLTIVLSTLMYKYFEVPVMALRGSIVKQPPATAN